MNAVLVPRGAGPSRLENGAILLALEELARAPRVVRLGILLEQVPRSLRAKARRTKTGVEFNRADLVNWVRSLRGGARAVERIEWN